LFTGDRRTCRLLALEGSLICSYFVDCSVSNIAKMSGAEEIVKEAPAQEVAEEAPAEETQKEAPAQEVAAEAPAEEAQKEAPAQEATEAPKEAPVDNKKNDDAPAKIEDTNGESKKVEENGAPVEIDETLKSKILTQIEYYFGDFNLPRDKFLQEEIKKDEGWVPLSTMLKFARLAQKTKDPRVVVAVIREAKDSFMEVDAEGTKIRRSVAKPAPDFSEGLQEESVKRTVYVKGFPKDGSCTLDDLLEFFKPHGEYDSVRMRKYLCHNTQAQGFKGSVLVVFKSADVAKAFIEGPPTQHGQTYLIKKWFAAYQEEKKQEAEERRAKRAAKDTGKQQLNEEIEEMPKGTFLELSGFAADTTREDIKAAVTDLAINVAHIDFSKGDQTAYVRFCEAGSNVKILEALKDKLTVNSAAISAALVDGEKEAELLEKAKEARRNSQARGNQQGRKRKGGWGQRGGRGKRQRN